MKLGLNLSFATKRWLEPKALAALIRDELQVEEIQFSWDLLNPWWPAELRDALAAEWGQAFREAGLVLDGTFGGLASYTYPHLLAPREELRQVALDFFKRAIDMTIAMGTDSIGTPLGGMDHADAYDEKRRAEIYKRTLELVRELASYGKKAGLKQILIEPTPLFTEFPGTPDECVQLMEDLGDTDIPVLYLLDWGHALMKPFLNEEADVDIWLSKVKPYIGAFHLQQTDGLLDRHWGFTQEGIIDVVELRGKLAEYGLDHMTQFVEIVYPFEATDEYVLDDMKKTMAYLRSRLAGGAK